MPKSILILIAFFLCACESNKVQETSEKNAIETVASSLVTEVMTKDKQDLMNPTDVLTDLLNGNVRFMTHQMYQRDPIAQLEQLTEGQHPKAVVLSCIDSRVPVEEVLDQGVGDLFVIRVAGNIDNDHNIASMEYGCKVAGAKVIIVLGHENCGAIKSAVQGVDMGNITELLTHLKPAIDNHKDFKGEQSVNNHDFLELVTKENALMTLDDLRNNSPIIKQLEAEGKLKLVAAHYDMDTGQVVVIDQNNL